MTKRYAFWAAAAAAAIALTACGGGSDSEFNPTWEPVPVENLMPPPPPPPPNPAPDEGVAPEPAPVSNPTPTPPFSKDRIEPLDTALLQAGALMKERRAVPRRVLAGASLPRVSLGPISVATPPEPEQTFGAMRFGPLKIGDGREVVATARPQDLAAMLRWQPAADGGLVAGVQFFSEGARAVRLGVLAESVPEGTVLRFYGEGDNVSEYRTDLIARIRSTLERAGISGDDARMVWGTDTAGAVSTLEIQLPPGAKPDQLRLAVPLLSHLYVNPALPPSLQKSAEHIGRSNRDNRDVMCRSDLEAESRSVAKMVFASKGGGVSTCTGTLMNDAANSQTPYLLTASHCVADPQALATLTTYWFFRSESCNGSPRHDKTLTALGGGAEVIFKDQESDISLLRLHSKPPANVVYAGSYFGKGIGPGLGAIGVHHPSGDLQKFSEGKVTEYSMCSVLGLCWATTAAEGNRLKVKMESGVVQMGSSGSPMFVTFGQTRYVAGALWGFAFECLWCDRGSNAYYGRLENAFPQGIHRWLSP